MRPSPRRLTGIALLFAVAACAARPQKAETPSLLREAQAEPAPGTTAAIRARIEAARRRGALEPLLRELRQGPREALQLYALGLAEFAAGNGQAAVAALRKAAELQPSDPDIQYRLGVALLEGGQPAGAREPLSRAAQLAPKVARYRPPLASCLSRLGDHRAAMEALRDVGGLDPSPDEAALAVKTARALTDLFRELPPPAREELEQSLAYLLRDAPGVAEPHLEALLSRSPDLAAAHALLGLAAARLDQTGRAVAALQRAAELAPDYPQPHAWLASLYAAKDKPELAAVEYQAALERNPLDPDTLLGLAMLLADERARAAAPAARLELTQRVESLLHRVLALQPENSMASRILAALRAG